MNIKHLINAMATMALSAITIGASANSVGFNAAIYDGVADTVEITVIYDYTNFLMFSGGLDLTYDPNVIEFVSYTQGPLPSGAFAAASPVGELTAPGLYQGFGFGSFEIFLGMSGSGVFGTFVFNVLGTADGASTPCSLTLCLEENALNPFISLFGEAVGADVLAAGISGANVVKPVPLPAAIWLMLTGLGVFLGLGWKAAQ